MPKEGNQKAANKDILANLSFFCEKLLQRMTVDSHEAEVEFLKILEHADKDYNKPKASHLTGWFYLCTRKRGPDIKLAQESVKKFTDPYTRLQEFKLLITKGNWDTGRSLNYFILLGLIKAIPGYQPLAKEDESTVFKEVRKLIIDNIDGYMRRYLETQHDVEQKRKEQEEKESAQQIEQERFAKVVLFDDLKLAQNAHQEHPDQIQFCLQQFYVKKTEKKWKIYWIDQEGTEFLFFPTKDLNALLLKNDNNFSKDNNAIKTECLKSRDVFFESIPLKINPQGKVKVGDDEVIQALSDAQLVERKSPTTFVLRGKTGSYQLSWISTLGQIKNIPLDNYPKLLAWLNAQKVLEQNEIPQLKAYLTKIKVAQTLQVDDFKEELTKCLSPKQEEELLPPQQPERSANKIDLTRFGNIHNLFKHHDNTIPKRPLAKTVHDKASTVIPVKIIPPVVNIESNAVTAPTAAEPGQPPKPPVPPKPPQLPTGKIKPLQHNGLADLIALRTSTTIPQPTAPTELSAGNISSL